MGKATKGPPQDDRRGDDVDGSGDDARQRLALTRVLIWAEREATAIGRPEVSEHLKMAIAALHQRR